MNLRRRIRIMLWEAFSKHQIEAETERVVREAIPKIESHLLTYRECKIGKTSVVDSRFDVSYTNKGFIELIPISCSDSKVSIDRAEEKLILYFKGRVENIQLGGGNKSYTSDYWIYLVHKGNLPTASN